MGLTNVEREGLVVDLVDAHARVVEAERQLGRDVAEARQRGLTWDEVGLALGMSKQAAHKRYRSTRVALHGDPLPSG